MESHARYPAPERLGNRRNDDVRGTVAVLMIWEPGIDRVSPRGPPASIPLDFSTRRRADNEDGEGGKCLQDAIEYDGTQHWSVSYSIVKNRSNSFVRARSTVGASKSPSQSLRTLSCRCNICTASYRETWTRMAGERFSSIRRINHSASLFVESTCIHPGLSQ